MSSHEWDSNSCRSIRWKSLRSRRLLPRTTADRLHEAFSFELRQAGRCYIDCPAYPLRDHISTKTTTRERVEDCSFGWSVGWVVAADEPTRPTVGVVSHKHLAAPAGARNQLIGLVRELSSTLLRTMFDSMREPAFDDFDVLWPVVGLHAVDVMRDLAFTERSSQLLFGDETMLVRIAAHVREMMILTDEASLKSCRVKFGFGSVVFSEKTVGRMLLSPPTPSSSDDASFASNGCTRNFTLRTETSSPRRFSTPGA
jgi:hypothetical protein